MIYNLKKYEKIAKEIINHEDTCIKIQRRLGVDVLAFADTHHDLTTKEEVEKIYEEYSEPHIVLLLGDHDPRFLEQILRFWPPNIMACVLGNHDRKTLYQDFALTELHGDIIKIAGVNIAGFSGSYKYKESNRHLLVTQEESLETCDRLLEKSEESAADILISHDLPFTEFKPYDVAHCGQIGITKFVYSSGADGPFIHLHAHSHERCSSMYLNNTKRHSIYKYEYLTL